MTAEAAANCADAEIVCALTRARSIGCITRMKEEEGAADHSGDISAPFQAFAVEKQCQLRRVNVDLTPEIEA